METPHHPGAPVPPAADQPLAEDMLAGDPMAQFGSWLADAEAAGLPEPNAMVLSTVSAGGWPQSRSVLLKAYGADGFTFYTNRTSGKGADLAACPRASLLFPWYGLRRQVIIQGAVAPLSQAASEPYFHSRPRGSQIGAWVSRQSTVISSRAVLDERRAELARRWPGPEPVPMPEFWGGYQVRHEIVEFWQGRADRLHDRLRYRREGSGWLIERLSP